MVWFINVAMYNYRLTVYNVFPYSLTPRTCQFYKFDSLCMLSKRGLGKFLNADPKTKHARTETLIKNNAEYATNQSSVRIAQCCAEWHWQSVHGRETA